MENLHKKDKEETKNKLIDAAGEIFKNSGYAALKASRIAYIAGVSATLIYRYFGNVQELFKAYLLKKDYWIPYHQDLENTLEANRHDSGRELAKNMLEKQMDYFYNNPEMQKIVRWEISEANDLSRSLADSRERLGDQMLGITDNHFKDSGVNFRVLLGLMIAGIYYLVLHAKTNGSTFCGIDINKEKDMKEVQKTLKQMVDWAYEKADA